jgi:hypothetical protein
VSTAEILGEDGAVGTEVGGCLGVCPFLAMVQPLEAVVIETTSVG